MKNYVGEKFGRLLVLEEVERTYTKKRKSGFRRLKCICDCGKVGIYYSNTLNGHTQSCGCLKKERVTKTGILKEKKNGIHPIYNARNHLRDRCRNIKNSYYKYYGGRGITYDPRREKFENFYEDMKEGREKGLSIDRIDNNGNYCKENCRWATKTQQQRNRKNNVIYKGKCISERAILLGVCVSTASYRIKKNKLDI